MHIIKAIYYLRERGQFVWGDHSHETEEVVRVGLLALRTADDYVERATETTGGREREN